MKVFLQMELRLNYMNIVEFSSFDFALTSYCQAGCPTCARYNQKDGSLTIKPTHMDFNKFEIMFLSDLTIWKNKQILFCGEFGDPMMHPKVRDFIDVVMLSPCHSLKINTNGGIRSPKFYKQLVERYDRLGFEFGIDGLTNDTNKYRYGVNTSLALQNMQTAAKYISDSSSDSKSIVWKFLVFDYNYTEVPEVLKLAKKWGIKKVLIYINARDFHIISQTNLRRLSTAIKHLPMSKYNYDIVGEYRNEFELF